MTDDLGRLARQLRGEEPEDGEDENYERVDIEVPEPLPLEDDEPIQEPTVPRIELPSYEPPPPLPEPPQPQPVPTAAEVAKWSLIVGWTLLVTLWTLPWSLIVGVVVALALWGRDHQES